MANTTFQVRNQIKADTYANWVKANPVLLDRELIAVVIPAEAGVAKTEPTVMFKLGDGTNKFSALGWASGLSADVYSWAKAASKPSYAASEISGLETYIKGQVQDTDTQYKLEADSNNARKFYLYSKAKGDTTWSTTPVSTITIPASTLVTGTSNGTVKFNGTDVAVKGLGSAAYKADTAFDEAGAASAVLGTSSDAASAATVYGAKAAAAAAQTKANAAMPKSGGTFTGLVTLSESPTSDLHAATKKYVDDAKSSAISTAAKDATSKANAAQAAAATDATTKANQALSDAKTYVDTKTAGLTGAMHFRGEVTAVPPKSGTYVSGDVVIFGSKEYVYDGTNWKELGDEGSHVLKTQKINGHALSGDITLTAADVGAATSGDITSKINELDVSAVGGSGKYISTISETNGKISATVETLPTALKSPNVLTVGDKTYDGSAAVTITASDLGAVTDVSGKQDKLTFDGTYNASTNKAATVSTVKNAIGALDVTDTAVAGQVVSAVNETDGKIEVTRRALAAEDIPTIAAAKVSGLATVATSGKIDDLTQTNYIIFDAGTATTVI